MEPTNSAASVDTMTEPKGQMMMLTEKEMQKKESYQAIEKSKLLTGFNH